MLDKRTRRTGSMATTARAPGLLTATSLWRWAGAHRRCTPTKHAPHPNPSRPRRRTRVVAAAMVQGEDAEFVRCAAGERLRDWIVENGGVVHPSLAVVTATRNTGSRGVVALEHIPVEVTSSEPLVLVPESLYLTSQVPHPPCWHWFQWVPPMPPCYHPCALPSTPHIPPTSHPPASPPIIPSPHCQWCRRGDGSHWHIHTTAGGAGRIRVLREARRAEAGAAGQAVTASAAARARETSRRGQVAH